MSKYLLVVPILKRERGWVDMLEKLKKILNREKAIDAWKIIEKDIKSGELFFITNNIDMDRGKEVKYYQVTVYKDFCKADEKYRGSSTVNIHPTMTELEIKDSLKEAITGAAFVRNRFYPLVEPEDNSSAVLPGEYSDENISDSLITVADAVFAADNFKNGWINSIEIFLNEISLRIINSNGVDVNYHKFVGELELITNWKENGEEIELYDNIKFGNLNSKKLTEEVRHMLEVSKERSLAEHTPALGSFTVLLTGKPVKELLKYYYQKSNIQHVYEQVSAAKLNESIQGSKITGDKLSLILDPQLKGSTESGPYDKDGFPLSKIEVVKDGILTNYWGSKRYSYYMNTQATGDIKNIIVATGNTSTKSLRESPHLEIPIFSHFQMDALTGDFGGEIRLGYYFDGKTTKPVTGGSISGNIKNIQGDIYFSREKQIINNFAGPRTIKLQGISIAGN